MEIFGTKTQVDNKKRSLWAEGKKQYKEFGNYHVKKTTFIMTTLYGIVLAVLCLLPFVFILVSFFTAFMYNPMAKLLIVSIAWALLLVYNGLSNYFTVEITKKYATDDTKLQSFDSYAIAFYNVLNPLFIVFSLLIIGFLLVGAISMGYF